MQNYRQIRNRTYYRFGNPLSELHINGSLYRELMSEATIFEIDIFTIS